MSDHNASICRKLLSSLAMQDASVMPSIRGVKVPGNLYNRYTYDERVRFSLRFNLRLRQGSKFTFKRYYKNIELEDFEEDPDPYFDYDIDELMNVDGGDDLEELIAELIANDEDTDRDLETGWPYD